MLIRRAGHGAGLEVHRAKTRESLDKKLDWDHLPGCSRWFGFIKQHGITEADVVEDGWGVCYFDHSGIKRSAVLNFCQDQNWFKVGFTVSVSHVAQSCSCLWTHLFNSLNNELSSFLKAEALQGRGVEEGAKEWTISVEGWNSSTMRQRRRRGASHERGQVQYHILPVRWL